MKFVEIIILLLLLLIFTGCNNETALIEQENQSLHEKIEELEIQIKDFKEELEFKNEYSIQLEGSREILINDLDLALSTVNEYYDLQKNSSVFSELAHKFI